jgi:hypothetical protein
VLNAEEAKSKCSLLAVFVGSTSVLHDSELPMEVDHCADPGCYSRAINYDASQRQMGALSEISLECHQSIKVSKTSFYYEKSFVHS